MNKFIKNIFMFIFIFVIFNLVPMLFPRLIMDDPYYGNKTFSIKKKYYERNKHKFNTVILGSSRLYRHMNPKILDAGLKDCAISSFNLASPATYVPESYYLYEHLLDSFEPNTIRYAFIELGSLQPIDKANVSTPRNYYWHTPQYFLFSSNYAIQSDKSIGGKLKFIYMYFSSLFYRLIYGYESYFIKQEIQDKSVLGSNKDGFYSLDDQMNDSDFFDNDYRQRFEEFKKKSEIISERIDIAMKEYSIREEERKLNKIHFNEITKMINKSQEKGISLIFIIPPRLNNYDEILDIQRKLPKSHVISMANPSEYPELYMPEFSFDIAHLNKKGADIFTSYFVDIFREYCSKLETD